MLKSIVAATLLVVVLSCGISCQGLTGLKSPSPTAGTSSSAAATTAPTVVTAATSPTTAPAVADTGPEITTTGFYAGVSVLVLGLMIFGLFLVRGPRS